MKHDPQQIASVFRIDVSADSASSPPSSNDASGIVIALLRQLVTAQERQNQLMEELIQQTSAAQKQRANELGQWKEANPGLARDCRAAAETLSQVQTSFLRNLTDEVMENQESLTDGEFMLNEFVDRFGPRLAHLNGVLQVLSQLSSQPATANNA